MSLSVHDIAILFSALAGFCMVIGGMLLIWKGAIALAGTDSSTALNIEWEKKFKLNTQAPGIAFFVLGLLFSSIAIYSSRETRTDPVYITGTVADVDETVTVTAAPPASIIQSVSNGIIEGKFTPPDKDNELINLRFTAAGYEDAQILSNLNKTKDRVIRFENVRLKRILDAIETKPGNIIPTSAHLPPIDSQPAFGSAQ